MRGLASPLPGPRDGRSVVASDFRGPAVMLVGGYRFEIRTVAGPSSVVQCVRRPIRRLGLYVDRLVLPPLLGRQFITGMRPR
ncbi:MAG: hypothetical protein QOC63_2537 [Mycobacterium sp.]|nr:hypothetical protein [Mycobacterium sp.]